MARYVCRHGLIAWRQAGSIAGGGGGPDPTGTMKRLPAQVRSRGGHVRSFGVAGSGGAAPSLPIIGRPVSDTLVGGWTPSAGVSLSAMLDETVPDDADFISTSSIGSTCELALNDTAYPGAASQTVSYRAASSTGNGITVTLKQGATVIATWSHALTPIDTLYTQALTSGQIALITSGALSIQLAAT